MRTSGSRCSIAVLVCFAVLTAFSNPALAQLGVCCFADGSCAMTPSTGCPAAPNAFFIGGCGTCDVITCTFACCASDGTCTNRAYAACISAGGNPQGSLTTCAPLPACPFTLASCCFPNGTCAIMTRVLCQTNAQGIFQGAGSTCNDFCAPPRGACCRGAQCAFVSQVDCGEHFWAGAFTSCVPSVHTCCPADINVSGFVSVQDIFDFLERYFAGSFAADFNRSCFLSVQDIFDFLAAYFTGCP